MAGTQIHPALTAMKTHLATKQADWGLRSIDDWPSYVEGAGGPSISLELESIKPVLVGVSHPTLAFDMVYGVRITYWSSDFKPRANYNDVLIMLDAIIVFLLTSSSPNAYGELLGHDQAFAPEVGNIPTNDPAHELFGGSITAPLTISTSVTQT
ncbi:MAG: hypothetical protein AB1752_11655 [Candidatus Zixiibacteriota bacterium]